MGTAGSGNNLYTYCGDNPTDATDPSGLRRIPFQFDAFIPGRLGQWLLQPGCSGTTDWHFKTDDREAGQPGTSRLISKGSIDSKNIGTATVANVLVVTNAGTSVRRWFNQMVDGEFPIFHYESATATPKGPAPTVKSTQTPVCETDVTIEAWASYPLGWVSYVAPSIYYKVTFSFVVVKKDTVRVVISATHSTFPDFEGSVDSRFPRYVFHTADSGPTYSNLYWNRTSGTAQTVVTAETPK